MKETNFWFRRFGIDLRVSVHSRRITPQELTQKMVSIFLAMSNSSRVLTHAFGRYFTSYWASLNFSDSLMPEWAKITLLKLIRDPLGSVTLITGPVLPIIITFASLSICSIVIPGLEIGFSQVYTPCFRRIMLFSSAKSRAISRLVMGPRSWSTSMMREYSKVLTISS